MEKKYADLIDKCTMEERPMRVYDIDGMRYYDVIPTSMTAEVVKVITYRTDPSMHEFKKGDKSFIETDTILKVELLEEEA